MISRSRSLPTVAARSIERTTSANNTVTCLYSADRVTCVTGAPHSLQNFEFGGSSVPHDPHGSPVAVSAPRLLSSTSVSCHRWSAMSVISPRHLRHEVSDPRMSTLFETRDAGIALRSDHRHGIASAEAICPSRGFMERDRPPNRAGLTVEVFPPRTGRLSAGAGSGRCGVESEGSPWRNRWSTASRMTCMALLRSPRRALSRAEWTSSSGKLHRLYSRRTNTSTTRS
jgi:hypothetical protein